MASTNKTTNYELSQYIGTDKPTYLSDYNGDMYKIDAQMKVNADNVATAISSAQTATTTANQANTTANSANTTANSASTTATNAQTTANSALSTATTAQSKANEVETELNSFEQKLNFTHFDNVALSDITVSNGTKNTSNLTVASNDDGDVAKIYGILDITGGVSGTVSFPTRLRPSEAITINLPAIIVCKNSSNQIQTITNSSLRIATDGTVTMDNLGTGGQSRYILPACLLFLTNFGDSPIE